MKRNKFLLISNWVMFLFCSQNLEFFYFLAVINFSSHYIDHKLGFKIMILFNSSL